MTAERFINRVSSVGFVLKTLSSFQSSYPSLSVSTKLGFEPVAFSSKSLIRSPSLSHKRGFVLYLDKSSISLRSDIPSESVSIDRGLVSNLNSSKLSNPSVSLVSPAHHASSLEAKVSKYLSSQSSFSDKFSLVEANILVVALSSLPSGICKVARNSAKPPSIVGCR